MPTVCLSKAVVPLPGGTIVVFAFRRDAGLRIDHALLSDALKARCTACDIDREPRANEQPSDHAPVTATLSFS